MIEMRLDLFTNIYTRISGTVLNRGSTVQTLVLSPEAAFLLEKVCVYHRFMNVEDHLQTKLCKLYSKTK